MMNTPKAIASSKRNPCPICQKDHGCKISSELILCLRGESTWNITGWKYIQPLRGGMGGLFRADSGNQDQVEYRPQPQQNVKKSKFKPLTDKELDKNARLILKQLGLSDRHRQELRKRGYTDQQIDEISFRSAEAYQHFIIPINPNFPGMGDRGTLTNSDSGYLIPCRNSKGLIVGFQLARDDRNPKYQWLWGSSERRVTGELPLQFLKVNDSPDLNIIEGTLKPLTSAYKHNINVLGAGGVNWQGSKQEFKAIINSKLFAIFILNPDAGCKANNHVIAAYRELYKFLKSLGVHLLVRDWGQGEKPKGQGLDVDEIDTETFNNTSIISYEQWDKEAVKSTDPISEEEWFKQFKLPKLNEDLGNILKRFYSRQFKKKLPEKTEPKPTATTPEPKPESSAIVLWKPQKITAIKYIPGQLPTVEEWAEMGYPRIIFEQGQRLQLIAEIYNQGGINKVQDTTPTGHGKSYDAGLINLETFGIDPSNTDNKTRIFYASPDHRNPTNKTVEANYVDLEGRHNGLIYDYERTTAMGKPHVVRANKNQNPDIPSNCPENGTFLTVAELGLPVFGGKDSPICQSCPLLSDGCPFLMSRQHNLSNERLIRTDINSIPTPSSDDILILEESDKNIENSHQVTITSDDVLKTVGKLQLRDSERIFKALRPILVAVYTALQAITSDKHKYGIPHSEVMKLMPSVDELNQLIWELYANDWLKADDVWGVPIWDYEMIDGEPEAVKIIGYDWVAPSLNDLKNECFKIFESYAKYINGLQSPEEKQVAIKANVIPSWLPSLIDCLTGNKRVNLRIDNGKLIINKPAKRHRNIIKNAGFSVALDATQSKEDYALSIGVSPNHIIEIKGVQRPTPNLHIHIINGLGKGGKQRRETMQDRIKIGVTAIAQRHKGQTIGLIDHKSAMDSYQDLPQSVKRGYWYRDTRGSNQFLNTQVMIGVGLPVPNLGQVAAEYQILTGKVVRNPECLTGHYGSWVKRKTRSELIQCIGRPRAHLRPDEDLHFYLLADLEEATLSAIRLAYPTATVTVEDVYDIAPSAAAKGVQTLRKIIKELVRALESGVDPSIDEIADKVGISKSGVSYTLKERLGIAYKALKKSLVLLLEAIKNKTELSALPDDAQWMARDYLPLVVQSLEDGQITPADVVVEVLDIPRCFGRDIGKRILAATPIPTLCKLLGAVLKFLPDQVRQELSDLISPRSPHLSSS